MRDGRIEGAFSYYGESVRGAGGVPVLICVGAPVADLVPRLDGLLLSGGEDVVPARYGGVDDDRATAHDEERDAFEAELIDAALAARIPILAICRGTQILNVALGGTLVAHLDETDGLSHAETDEHRSARRHGVQVVPGSDLARALAPDIGDDHRLRVNSYHHQAIAVPGRGLRVVARADDGTVEGVEIPGRSVVGVQWHPEMHAGTDPIFHWFIDSTRHLERSAS